MNNRNGRKKDRTTYSDYKNNSNKKDKEPNSKKEDFSKRNILNKNQPAIIKMLVRLIKKIKYSIRKILKNKILLEQMLRRKSNKFL